MSKWKEHLCDHGDCENTNVEVRVSYNDERPTFCCADHAAMWLLEREYRHAPWFEPVREALVAKAR